MDVSSNNINAVLLSLQMDILKIEELLEKAINSKGDLEFKIIEIKAHLRDLVYTEQILGKFQSLIAANTKSE